MENPFKLLHQEGQSAWLDFIRRSLITSGELKNLVEKDKITGVTSNPTIFDKAIAGSPDYDAAIRSFLAQNKKATIQEVYEHLAIDDIRRAADILHPVYQAAHGHNGFVSLEVSPQLAADTDGTIVEARRLWQTVARPNLMIKVPATKAGIPAIEKLIAAGINVNVTLMFSLAHYESVAQAYLRGLARCVNKNSVASVASFFVSRVDTLIDQELNKIETEPALALRGQIAIANCKLVYQRFLEIFQSDTFHELRQQGGMPQRVLWASTSTKNPAYSDVLYVEKLIGRDTVNTIPPETIQAFRDHGQVAATLVQDIGQAKKKLAELDKLGVSLDAAAGRLQEDGVKAFAASFDKLMTALKEKVARLAGS